MLPRIPPAVPSRLEMLVLPADARPQVGASALATATGEIRDGLLLSVTMPTLNKDQCLVAIVRQLLALLDALPGRAICSGIANL